MDQAKKTALKSGGVAGLIGAAVIAPIATPVLWAALAYGTYRFTRGIYLNAKLKESSKGDKRHDTCFL